MSKQFEYGNKTNCKCQKILTGRKTMSSNVITIIEIIICMKNPIVLTKTERWVEKKGGNESVVNFFIPWAGEKRQICC